MRATVSRGERRDQLPEGHVRLVLLLELAHLLPPECPLMPQLIAYLDGPDDRRLTEFYNSKLGPEVRQAIGAIRQAVFHLQHLDPQISLATLPSLISHLCASAPAKVAAVRHDPAPPVIPRPSLPSDARNRHRLIGNEIAWALEPLKPMLPQCAIEIWPRHRPTNEVPVDRPSKRGLKGAHRVAVPLRAKIEKWIGPIIETVTAAAAALAMPTEELMGIDQIARIPEHRNGCQDGFPVAVFQDRHRVDGERKFTVRFTCRSRRLRLRVRYGLSTVCEASGGLGDRKRP